MPPKTTLSTAASCGTPPRTAGWTPGAGARLALALTLAALVTPPASSQVPGHRALQAERPQIRESSKLKRLEAMLATQAAAAEVPAVQPLSAPGPALDREVLGYLPYWEMGYDFPHWELISIVAWFGAEMNSAGQVTATHGWGGAATEDLVAQAHAHGVRVIVTVTNFDNSSIATLLSSAGKRQTAIASCLELMATHGADGVNIDFEFVPASAKADFVTFMADLKTAVFAAQPNGGPGHVSLAGPAVDWSGAYDYDALLASTDGIMVMAYGYHWSGGSPGPTAPLYGGGIWGKHSVAWTIDDYLTYGGVENRHKVIIGLPFYGRRWPVASQAVPGTALGTGASVTFDVAHAEAAANGATWEDQSKTIYYHRTLDGQLWQYWYDDPAAFGMKLAYIAEKDLGGIGIWALGYDGDIEGYWAEIEDHLGALPGDPPVDDPPVDDPPADDPPADDPPADDPPVDDPPADDPPVDDPPVDDPAAADPPADDPPVDVSPADDPPADDPPADDPPADDPPADDPPGETGTGGDGPGLDGTPGGEVGGYDGAIDPDGSGLEPDLGYRVLRTDSSTRTHESVGAGGCAGGSESPLGALGAAAVLGLWLAARRRRGSLLRG